MKTVSVIIPAYNAEKYLAECLDSICAQTYQNLEIIVVDDGSKDSTAAILKEYEAKDARIRGFYSQNHGVSFSRNFGIEYSTGDYVAFVDADDIVAPDFIAQMVDDLEKTNADMAAVGVAKNKHFQSALFTQGETVIYENAEILKQLFGSYQGFVWNKKSLSVRISSLMWIICCPAKK